MRQRATHALTLADGSNFGFRPIPLKNSTRSIVPNFSGPQARLSQKHVGDHLTWRPLNVRHPLALYGGNEPRFEITTHFARIFGVLDFSSFSTASTRSVGKSTSK
jgi:hypothetical protein